MTKITPPRVECLDGLRGIAALWVLVGHCVLLTGWSLPVVDKPDLGVDLFMMLSGFLMVFQYHLRAEKEPWAEPGTWMKFWTRRYFRIAPLYYIMLAAALISGPVLLAWRTQSEGFLHLSPLAPENYTDAGPANIAAHLSFLFGLLPHYAMRTPLPDWSLGLEMQFYAVFPALMLLTRKFGWMGTVVLTSLVAALATHASWHYDIRYPLPSFLPFKIDIFLAGMLLAESCRRGPRTAGFYLVLALILAAGPFQGEASLMRLLVREVLVLGFFALVLHRFLPTPLAKSAGKIAAILGNNPFRWLGEVSYSVYLLHVLVLIPVSAFVIWSFGHGIPAWARFAIVSPAVLALTYPLAWLSYRFIEMPGQAVGRLVLRRISGKAIGARADRPESLAAP